MSRSVLADFRCECATDGGSAGAECQGDGVETSPLLAQGAGKFDAFGNHDGGPSAVSALPAGSGVGAFDDHAAFHLGKGRHNVEEEFSTCCSSVEFFCEGTECDATFAKSVDGVDDLADRSSEPVEFPDSEDIAVMVA